MPATDLGAHPFDERAQPRVVGAFPVHAAAAVAPPELVEGGTRPGREVVREIVVERSELSGPRDVTVAAFDEGTRVELRDVRIRDSLERECVELPEDDADHCSAGRERRLAG